MNVVFCSLEDYIRSLGVKKIVQRYFLNNNISTKHDYSLEKLIYLPECQSTNDIAFAMLHRNLVEDGTVIITDHQTAGRGQMGTQWLSTPGLNLTFSYVKAWTKLDIAKQFQISAATSLALAEALHEQSGLPIDIKWPNDLYCRGKKLGGILIQNTISGSLIDYSVIGVGVNVNQSDFQTLTNATSLSIESNRNFEKRLLLQFIKNSLDKWLIQVPSDKVFQQYQQDLLYLHDIRRFTLANGVTIYGKITGVNEDGKLIVQTAESTKCYGLKEIIF
jgi:BirA family biotin operon repressor/biotin-[acetyl-CoA-carboxylase] ligase